MNQTIVWQELMDQAYDKWQKHPQMPYNEFLYNLNTKEQQAVLLGNLNYQVGNGGFDQWVSNGYATHGEDVIEVLQLMATPIATELVERLPDLLDFVDLDQDNRGCDDYWKDPEDIPSEMMDELANWFYSVNEQFEEEVEEFLSK